MASGRLLPKSLLSLEAFIWPDKDDCHLPSVVPKHVCRRAWFTGDMDFTSYKDEAATLV